jgi:hypothetical protein
MEALKVSTWNVERLNELSGRTDAGFKEVEEIKDLRAEMKEGFAQMMTRDEMNERLNAVDKRLGDLTRLVQISVVVVGAAFVGNGLLG